MPATARLRSAPTDATSSIKATRRAATRKSISTICPPGRSCSTPIMPSGASYNPVISPDGNFIIFASDARAGVRRHQCRHRHLCRRRQRSRRSRLYAGFEPRQRQPARRRVQSGRDHQRRRPVHRVRQQRLQFSRATPRHRRYFRRRSDFGPQRDHPGKRQFACDPHRERRHRADRRSQRRHAQRFESERQVHGVVQCPRQHRMEFQRAEIRFRLAAARPEIDAGFRDPLTNDSGTTTDSGPGRGL